MVIFYFLVLKPEKYVSDDLYETIMNRGVIRVGINLDSRPFGFRDEKGEIKGFDADLERISAHYILKSSNAVEFIPVTHAHRILKASTGEVDIVIATLTINPQRLEIIDFSIPYDSAGQAILVTANSKISSMGDLGGENVGVIFGTTAEKNMKNLVPSANLLGFKTYENAYKALKKGAILAITSDDTILKRYTLEDDTVKILPKRYSKEPYGMGFKKGKSSQRLKKELDFAINDMKQKNIITRLRKKWELT